MVFKTKDAKTAWLYCYEKGINPETVTKKGNVFHIKVTKVSFESNMPKRHTRNYERAALCIERGTN